MPQSDSSNINTYAVYNKERERKERLVEYLGELLVPQTEGFKHVNLDMSFTYLGNSDLYLVDEVCTSIILAEIYELKQSEYLLRGKLASFLNSRRSRNAKSMDMFTTMVTRQEQKFEDTTEQKQGFSWFGFGRKKNQQN